MGAAVVVTAPVFQYVECDSYYMGLMLGGQCGGSEEGRCGSFLWGEWRAGVGRAAQS